MNAGFDGWTVMVLKDKMLYGNPRGGGRLTRYVGLSAMNGNGQFVVMHVDGRTEMVPIALAVLVDPQHVTALRDALDRNPDTDPVIVHRRILGM